jgi:hypothetical protein
MPPTHCMTCGKNLALVGKVHNCGSSQPVEVVHKVVHANKASRHGKYADMEKRRAYRRAWMRKKRAGAPST